MTEKPTSSSELARLKDRLPKDLVPKLPTTQNEVAEQALSVALMPDFIQQLNEVVGQPREGETRNQYIERGIQEVISGLTYALSLPCKPDKA